MNGSILNRMRRAASRLTRQPASPDLILLYHRIAECTPDPWSLCVSPKHFAEHLDVLESLASVLPLDELVATRCNSPRSRPRVALTFDDGYLDNFTRAKPLLESRNIPATFFITSVGLNQQREFWWDALELLTLQPKRLPESLALLYEGKCFVWTGDSSNAFTAPSRCGSHASWRALDQPPPTVRHDLYLKLYQWLSMLQPQNRDRALNDLHEWAGVRPTVRDENRCMSVHHVAALARSALFHIGAHTVTHPFLSRLNPVRQSKELFHNKTELEEITGRTVSSLAFPHGDYSDDTLRIVRSTGFARACTTHSAALNGRADPLQLPRVVAADWTGDEFARNILFRSESPRTHSLQHAKTPVAK